jgi:hypothetical protein
MEMEGETWTLPIKSPPGRRARFGLAVQAQEKSGVQRDEATTRRGWTPRKNAEGHANAEPHTKLYEVPHSCGLSDL